MDLRAHFSFSGAGIAAGLLALAACGDSGGVASNDRIGNGGAGGTTADAGGGSGTAGTTACDPGSERVCLCFGVPNGTERCGSTGVVETPCPPCAMPGGAGGGGGVGGGGDPCSGHCTNGARDCGETDVDCGGECAACGPIVYEETDCIKSARNGSEICDDAAWKVEAPGTGLVLVCLTDAGGVIYVARNTGPPDPDDGVRRCQGWEKSGENAWDHLTYIDQLECNAEQDRIDLDLSAYVGQTLYFGAHDDPAQGDGRFTHMCVAWAK